MKYVLELLIMVAMATANIYLHNPRGSNNRLNEKTATRSNAQRLFDSQVFPYRHTYYIHLFAHIHVGLSVGIYSANRPINK